VSQKTLASRIGAGLSSAQDAVEAASAAAGEAGEGLAGEPDLAFLFLSADHLEEAAEAAEAVRSELSPAHLVGCVADGVVGRGREVEDGPGAAVWAAALPGAAIEPFHAVALETDEGVAVAGFPELENPTLVSLLVDPFSFPVAGFLARLNLERPGVPLVGGIAAGGGGPGEAALILEDEVYSDGAVGVALGGVPVVTAVSQGCAPIGREAVITRAEGNVVFELAGKPALYWVRSQLASISPEQQRLAARGLLAGLVIDENKAEYERGDYLIRGLIGVDEESGSIAIGEHLRVGQTLRLHARDAASADEDLRGALSDALAAGPPAGALLFTCNGRGTHMFPDPDHDARVVAEELGAPALAGFFCGGEIGPVGGRAFLHGFTATLAVFLEA
jgi:small ligand-binding sensory domain FIST